MKRTLEAIFRHLLQLLTLLLLLPIVGVAVAYFLVPRQYQSTASLWALERYAIVNSSGLDNNELVTPAQTQATALSELLQTRTFALAVVNGINLAPTLNLSSSVLSNPQELQDALFNEISKKVTVTPQAYYLLEVSYTNPNPQIAQEVVQSVIRNYGYQSLGLSVAEGQYLLSNYRTQLQAAQQAANAATQAEAQYVTTHPQLTENKLITDPEYAQLDAKRVQAETNVQNIQNTISTIQQAISVQDNSANTLFQVIDAPQLPARSVSRTKEELLGGAVGLVLAFLAILTYLVIQVRRDRTFYSAQDLKDAVTIPVIIQLPSFSPGTISLLTTGSVTHHTQLIEAQSSSNSHITRK